MFNCGETNTAQTDFGVMEHVEPGLMTSNFVQLLHNLRDGGGKTAMSNSINQLLLNSCLLSKRWATQLCMALHSSSQTSARVYLPTCSFHVAFTFRLRTLQQLQESAAECGTPQRLLKVLSAHLDGFTETGLPFDERMRGTPVRQSCDDGPMTMEPLPISLDCCNESLPATEEKHKAMDAEAGMTSALDSASVTVVVDAAAVVTGMGISMGQTAPKRGQKLDVCPCKRELQLGILSYEPTYLAASEVVEVYCKSLPSATELIYQSLGTSVTRNKIAAARASTAQCS